MSMIRHIIGEPNRSSMSFQRIKICWLLNFWFTTTYDLIGFLFALMEPSFKFEVPGMVLTLALVSVNLHSFEIK